MRRLSSVLAEGSDGSYWFMCPGCDSPVRIKGWQFDGNVDRPTFAPSVLTTMPDGNGKYVCHSFVRDGKIQFLGDCTHALKGQTVDLPELPDWILSE